MQSLEDNSRNMWSRTQVSLLLIKQSLPVLKLSVCISMPIPFFFVSNAGNDSKMIDQVHSPSSDMIASEKYRGAKVEHVDSVGTSSTYTASLSCLVAKESQSFLVRYSLAYLVRIFWGLVFYSIKLYFTFKRRNYFLQSLISTKIFSQSTILFHGAVVMWLLIP